MAGGVSYSTIDLQNAYLQINRSCFPQKGNRHLSTFWWFIAHLMNASKTLKLSVADYRLSSLNLSSRLLFPKSGNKLFYNRHWCAESTLNLPPNHMYLHLSLQNVRIWWATSVFSLGVVSMLLNPQPLLSVVQSTTYYSKYIAPTFVLEFQWN